MRQVPDCADEDEDWKAGPKHHHKPEINAFDVRIRIEKLLMQFHAGLISAFVSFVVFLLACMLIYKLCILPEGTRSRAALGPAAAVARRAPLAADGQAARATGVGRGGYGR